MINDIEVANADRKERLRAEARERAEDDVKDAQLEGPEAETFFWERAQHHYAELEDTWTHNRKSAGSSQ